MSAALRRRRAAAQHLPRPATGGPAELVRALLAVQAQDPRAARLALRARSRGLVASAVDGALAQRVLAVGWLMRGTLHLVAAADYGWLLGLTAPTRMASNARRLAQEGVAPADADRAVALVARALAEDGPQTRAQLAARMAAAGIRTEGQATPHLLMLAALRGVAVLGAPAADGSPAFVAARDHLGGAPPTALDGVARNRALVELARRWLAAHGPGTAADLAAWAGLPLRDARAGLGAIAAELMQDGDLVDLAAREPAPRGRIPPRLLGAFDPYLLGWKDRTFAVDPQYARRAHPGGGMLRPVAIVDGRVVATWTRGRQADSVELEPFTPLPAGDERALQADARDVARFEAG
jgi:hypothetical protein